MPTEFPSMGEYLKAVKVASDGGPADPRLVPYDGPNEPLTEEQLARMEALAGRLDVPRE